MIVVDDLTVKEEAGVEPNSTPVMPTKFVPVIVTVVPPRTVPLAGFSFVMTGAT